MLNPLKNDVIGTNIAFYPIFTQLYFKGGKFRDFRESLCREILKLKNSRKFFSRNCV